MHSSIHPVPLQDELPYKYNKYVSVGKTHRTKMFICLIAAIRICFSMEPISEHFMTLPSDIQFGWVYIAQIPFLLSSNDPCTGAHHRSFILLASIIKNGCATRPDAALITSAVMSWLFPHVVDSPRSPP